jgi:hypothetical protein
MSNPGIQCCITIVVIPECHLCRLAEVDSGDLDIGPKPLRPSVQSFIEFWQHGRVLGYEHGITAPVRVEGK